MKIGDICEVVRGSSPRPRDDSRYYDGPVPRLMIADVTRDGKYVSAKIDSLTELGAKQSRPMSRGEVVIAVSGAPGLPAVLAHDACIHDGFAGLRKLDTTQVNIDFLYRYLIFVRLQSSGRAVGAIFKNLTTEQIRETIIPDFPIAQQKHIAAILDQAEALRSLRRQSIGQLDALARSVFLEMFGDASKNDRGWKTEQMGNLIQIRRGASPRPIDKYMGGNVNWIKIGDGTKGSEIYLERCADKVTEDGAKKSVFLKAGSLIFANCGVSLGFARILKIDGCIHDGWLSFENIPETKLDKIFLLKALNSITEYFREIAPSGTQPNLNTGLMKNFQVILPPLALQQEFADRIGAIEALKTTHRQSLAKLDALFASLQHRAFRGEL
jgi:type I restriction enzyme, S subunit